MNFNISNNEMRETLVYSCVLVPSRHHTQLKLKMYACYNDIIKMFDVNNIIK